MKTCNPSKLRVFIALLHLSLTACARPRSLTIALRSPPPSEWPSPAARAEALAAAAEAAKARGAALKAGKNANEDYLQSAYPRGYGAYSLSLRLGTPPQEIHAIMDTGSDVVWLPCTANYTCQKCTAAPGSDHRLFLPERSSSASRPSCASPLCKSLHGNSTERLCFAGGRCSRTLGSCAREACPSYRLWYGRGSAAGRLLTDTLTVAVAGGGKRGIRGFGFGCSKLCSRVPWGVGTAGFGRGGLSMPSQLSSVTAADKFGYCLLSHAYDSRNRSSAVVVGSDAVPRGVGLHYTPFLTNRRAQNSAYGVYYYVGLRGISVGGKLLKLPSRLLGFDRQGHGGTIIDSGTTFSIVDEKIFEEIARGFDFQVAYRRARAIEAESGLGLCYNISGRKRVSVPAFALHFEGGSRMSLPFENYFKVFGGAMCLTVLSAHSRILNVTVGPAVILGNYQQQNFYILYDRENNRLGFAQQKCKSLDEPL